MFKCLPDDGGLLDQDPAILEAFSLIINTERQHSLYKKQKEENRKKRESNDKKR
jgi:hypothetical protein